MLELILVSPANAYSVFQRIATHLVVFLHIFLPFHFPRSRVQCGVPERGTFDRQVKK
jgi:hypothetical protein